MFQSLGSDEVVVLTWWWTYTLAVQIDARAWLYFKFFFYNSTSHCQRCRYEISSKSRTPTFPPLKQQQKKNCEETVNPDRKEPHLHAYCLYDILAVCRQHNALAALSAFCRHRPHAVTISCRHRPHAVTDLLSLPAPCCHRPAVITSLQPVVAGLVSASEESSCPVCQTPGHSLPVMSDLFP